MKLLTAGGTRGIDSFQRLVKRVLCQVLAFFPVACHTIDGMKHEPIIFPDEFFDCLSSRHLIHYITRIVRVF